MNPATATPSTRNTSVFSTSTTTWCAVATSSITPPPSTTTSWLYFRSSYYITSSTRYAAVYHFDPVDATCDNYKSCSLHAVPQQANPDIGGIGALSAFLFTAWIVFVMTFVAYWGGLLPEKLLRNADRICFRANSRHTGSKWKHTFEDVILILSDQQLCFGIGILIAGYYEAFAQDLDVSHWNMVTYLAWLSSTVHLMTLSMLKERLNQNHLLRNVRIAGMITMFVLLLVALVPSTHNSSAFYFYDLYNKFPVRCTFAGTPVLNYPNGFGLYVGHNYSSAINPAVSYATLVVVYLWKLGQLFDHSSVFIQHCLRDAPRSKLQNWVKRTIPESGSRGFLHMHHSLAKFCFLVWSVWAEALDCFMATFIALLFALVWGTEQLLVAHYGAPTEVRQGESAWSFGQILTLLLLLQPAMAVVETFSTSKSRIVIERSADLSASASEITLAEQQHLPRGESDIKKLTKSQTLSSTLSMKTDPSITVTTISRTHLADPVVAHLYNSRMFKGYLYLVPACFITLMTVVVVIGGLSYDPTNSTRGLVSCLSLAGLVLFIPLAILCTWPCSRRLR